jgi:hypothetical protein
MRTLRNVAEKLDFIKRRGARIVEFVADCRHGNSNAMNSPGSDSLRRCTEETEKLFAFDLALERAALRG